jgi:hypothetical protein
MILAPSLLRSSSASRSRSADISTSSVESSLKIYVSTFIRSSSSRLKSLLCTSVDNPSMVSKLAASLMPPKDSNCASLSLRLRISLAVSSALRVIYSTAMAWPAATFSPSPTIGRIAMPSSERTASVRMIYPCAGRVSSTEKLTAGVVT